MDGFLLIDKSAGPTSHDVIDRVRKITGVRRVGHAGTLDPFATGLLIVGVGRGATRHMSKIVGLDKIYEAVFILGASSDTDDRMGKIEEKKSGVESQESEVQVAMEKFIGDIQQVPPSYSAIKIGGKKMYEAARKGKPIKAAPRSVRIDSFDLVEFTWPRLTAKIACGSGTYIRAIARDLGNELGVGGYVEELRRISIGPLSIDESVTLDALEHQEWSNFLVPVDRFLKLLPESH